MIPEKIKSLFQRRNNFSLSTLNQRRNLTLKQRWFGVNSKKQSCCYFMFSYKTEIFYINVEKISVFERQNNVALSTLNQRQSLTLKQR